MNKFIHIYGYEPYKAIDILLSSITYKDPSDEAKQLLNEWWEANSIKFDIHGMHLMYSIQTPFIDASFGFGIIITAEGEIIDSRLNTLPVELLLKTLNARGGYVIDASTLASEKEELKKLLGKLKRALEHGDTNWNVPFNPIDVAALTMYIRMSAKLNGSPYSRVHTHADAAKKIAEINEKIFKLLRKDDDNMFSSDYANKFNCVDYCEEEN
jgi:hypothetical protein